MKKLVFALLLLIAGMSFGATLLFEDFEEATFPPAGWTLEHPSGNADWKRGYNDVDDHTIGSGGHYANYNFYNASNYSLGYLISDVIEIPASEHTLSFWANYYHVGGGIEPIDKLNLDIALVGDDNAETWTAGTVNYIDGQAETGWIQISVDLSNFEGQNYLGEKIKFRFAGFSHYGSYDVAVDDVKIEGEGAPAIPEFTIVPESHVFESTTTGTVSSAVDFVISNTGEGALEIVEGAITLVGDNADQFALNLDGLTFPISLEGEETVTVPVTFSPESAGTKTAQIQIVDNITKAINLVDLSGEGVEAGSEVFSEDFEGVGDNSVPENWTILNENNDGVNWMSAASSAGTKMQIKYNSSVAMDDWAITPGISLTGGKVYSISFRYACQNASFPEKLGIHVGTDITVDSQGEALLDLDVANMEYQLGIVNYTPAADGVFYIGFHGHSLKDMYRLYFDDVVVEEVSAPAIPEFTIVPENHTFESTTTGTVSSAVDFVISNTGEGALEIVEGAITLVGDNADQFALNLDGLTFPISLEGEETVTVPVTFSPESAGTKTAQIQIVDNITKAINLVDLSGEGVDAIPGFAIDKEAYVFTRTFVNETSETVDFVITNSGDGELAIAADGITLIGDNVDQFTLDLTEAGLPANLAAGETTTIKATFNPTLLGENSAQIKIVDNIAKAEHLVDLSATCFEGYEEDFEGDTFPEGWSVKTNTLADGGLNGANLVDPATTDYSTWFDFTSTDLGGSGAIYVHTGDKAIGVFGGDFAVNLQWLISKEYTLGNDPELAFWMYFLRNDVAMFGSPNKLYVQIKEVGSKEGWETILSYDSGTITDAYYNEQSAELINYANKLVQLAFVLDCTEYHTSSKAIIDDFSISTKDNSSIEEIIPESTVLYQNYPNPFNPNTTIKFFNKNAGSVKLSVFNIKGELVQNLVNRNMQEGNHSINFNASNLNSGVYYYTLQTAEKSITKKMIMVK